MKTSVFCFILMLLCGHSFAQSSTSPLRLEKKKVYQDDVVLKYKDVKPILVNNSLSSAEFKTHKTNQTIASSFAIVGCGLTALGGYLLFAESVKEADEIDDGNLNYKADYSGAMTALGAGLACVVVSIPFSIKAKKSFKKSIDLYNSGIKETGCNGIDFRMNLSYNQVGLTMRF